MTGFCLLKEGEKMYFLIVVRKDKKLKEVRLTMSKNADIKRTIAAALMNNGIDELTAVDAAEWAEFARPCDVYRADGLDIYASK